MYFSVAPHQESNTEWQARVAELPGAVGTGEQPDLALRDAQANASRIPAQHLDSEGSHPELRRFLKWNHHSVCITSRQLREAYLESI